jgi:hypothetical protein
VVSNVASLSFAGITEDNRFLPPSRDDEAGLESHLLRTGAHSLRRENFLIVAGPFLPEKEPSS